MKCLVTGAAGFIGSRLSLRLLQEGYSVIGIDCFTDYYARELKEQNLALLQGLKDFLFISEDINSLDLLKWTQEVDVVFHLAAQAGVRASWGTNFSVYTHNNILATQRLLEAAKESGIEKFVYASSSSVYGASQDLPSQESSPTRPYSPYGVSKLAAEHLCSLYAANFGVPTVSLRFFTVYGPGQRPDMAFHKFMKAAAQDRPITVFGDGEQTRDFTYIDDIVDASLAALTRGRPGEIYNVGGGHRRILKDLFPIFEKVSGCSLRLEWQKPQKGDVPHTSADINKAALDLGYAPKAALEYGLEEEWKWIKKLYKEG